MKPQVIKSEIFSQYNIIKAQDQNEIARRISNRALGLVQAETHRPYRTTPTSCTCAWFTYRHTACKHMKALVIRNQAEGKKLENNKVSGKSLLELAVEAYSKRNESRENWRTGEKITIWQGTRHGKTIKAFLSTEHGRVMLYVTGYPKAVKVGTGTGQINSKLEEDYTTWANRAKKFIK